MRYEDFIIQIDREDEAGHRVRVLDSPAGQGVGHLRVPAELNPDRLTREVRSRKTRRASTESTRHLVPAAPAETKPVTTHHLGEGLFEALFTGQVRSLFDQSLGILRGKPGSGLRVKLKFDPRIPGSGKLQALPWELLRRAETQEYLSLSRLSPVVRFLDVPRPSDALRLPPPLRAMVVISSPSELEELAVEKEKEKLQSLEEKGVIKLSFPESIEPDALRRALVEEEAHILHFIGHGGFDPISGDGVLYLTGSHGEALPINGTTLATILRDVDTLRLAVLNACETARATRQQNANPFAGVASALVLGGMPAVVAMQAPISDDAAILFSQAFYRQLSRGAPVDTAITEGRQAIHAVDPEAAEWSTPVLFSRIPDGQLFLPEVAESKTSDSGKKLRSWVAFFVLITVTMFVGVKIWPYWTAPKNPEPEEMAKSSEISVEKQEPPPGKPKAEVVDKPKARVQTPPPKTPPSSPPPESFPAQRPAPIGDSILQEAVHFKSSIQGFNGILKDILELPDNQLCWLITLKNNTEKEIQAGFNFASSYLADERGKRYEIGAADSREYPSSKLDLFRPGSSRTYWMVFEPSPVGARSFKAFLRNIGSAPAYKPFRVQTIIPIVEEVEPEVLATPKGAVEVATEQQAINVRGVEGLEAKLGAVWLMTSDQQAGHRQNRIRWSFAFHNDSLKDLHLVLALSAVHLEDDLGNIYSVLASSAGERSDQSTYIESLPGGLRLDTWLEFPAPRPGAQTLTARIVSSGSELEFDPITISIPNLAENYRYTPQILKINAMNNGQFGTGIDGVEARLLEVERLRNGSLRWQVEFHNRSSQPQEIGFDLAGVQLSDGSRSYQVLSANNGLTKDDIYQEALPVGNRVFHWFDFAEPPAISNQFQLILSSHDGSFRYSPLVVHFKSD